MKNLSILKILFLIHIVGLASYYFYQFHYVNIENKMTGHLPKKIIKENKDIEVRPKSFDFSENKKELPAPKTIKDLIQEHGPNFFEPKEKMSILMMLIQEEQRSLFKEVLPSIENIDHQNIYGATALVLASSDGDLEVTSQLLKKGANPNINFNKMNFTLLMDAAIEGNEMLVKMLLEHGASIDATDKDGKTALIYAAREGNIEVLKVLIESGANKKIKDKSELSALDYAIMFEHKGLYSVLK